ncbi:MAG TPA: hypothetical protein PLG90_04440 [Ignavibacteria bacterium]|nr:hypothetical protein [Ignavibacteria bacterium]
MNNLNKTQIEILKLFESHKSEEELISLKNFLKNYLNDKLMLEIKNSNYDEKQIEDYKNLHFRIPDDK